MKEILTNPWVLGIGSAVIAGLILYFVFGIGKPKHRNQSDKPATDIRKNIQNQTAQPSVTVGDRNANVVINQNIVQNEQSTSEKEVGEIRSSKVSPQEMFEYLKGLPPFQRKEVAKNYKDIRVIWKAKLYGHFSSGGIDYLTLKVGVSYCNVVCPIDLTKYPEFKIMREDEDFFVEGAIDYVEAPVVHLKNCSFKFNREN